MKTIIKDGIEKLISDELLDKYLKDGFQILDLKPKLRKIKNETEAKGE